ncbi:sulfotransferase domain-containing protein [bacterium]|nr:sulfotransferase domain-containing protein [bacterium]
MIQDVITIVSGLPRSGTSMMMKMLEGGGLEVMTDNLRTADEDNPKGYFELEAVKELKTNSDWVKDGKGKVVKVISQLLKDLPTDYTFKIIFMRRKMDEILASQKQMLIRRGEPTDTVSDEQMAKMFNMHLLQIESWLEKQPNMEVLYVHYGDALKDPGGTVEKVNRFLGYSLDANKMAAVVDHSLHRQRA